MSPYQWSCRPIQQTVPSSLTKESKEGDWRLDDLLARYSKTDGLKFHEISALGQENMKGSETLIRSQTNHTKIRLRKKNSSGPSPHNLAVWLSDINQHSWI